MCRPGARTVPGVEEVSVVADAGHHATGLEHAAEINLVHRRAERQPDPIVR
jgi:hypothetical protein